MLIKTFDNAYAIFPFTSCHHEEVHSLATYLSERLLLSGLPKRLINKINPSPTLPQGEGVYCIADVSTSRLLLLPSLAEG